MGRLTLFELEKTWGKRSFRFIAGLLFFLNLFFLWYTNLGDQLTPELSAYKAFADDIHGMSETEKDAAVCQLKQTIDGVSFVRDILSMQNSDIGAAFAAQEIAENPGKFEAYHNLYESESYLTYTDSLDKEIAFIHEIANEENKVANYESFLRSVQETESALNRISVFDSQEAENFSARNIQKSAEDYRKLLPSGLKWFPAKSVDSAVKSVWTDILLILLSFCFIGISITEEKQRGLFYMTRSTQNGFGLSIIAKLTALLIHCLFSTVLFYLSNICYFGFAAGWCDFTAKIQSLAPYMESNLPISILTFLELSVITKAFTLFAAGTVIMLFCVCAENGTWPYLAGIGFWIGNWALYRFIPAASKSSVARYLNLFAALRSENLYGSYLNLSIAGYPISRIELTWVLIALFILAGSTLNITLFCKGENLEIEKVAGRDVFSFQPHSSIFRHESYKILITNHALLLLAIFCFLIGLNSMRRSYTPTTQECYYQDMMLRLEGELTEEKAALIEGESARYQKAFDEIERIEGQVSSGVIDPETGEAMKLPWYSVLSFYPEYLRVEQQLESIRNTGGMFVYDTGYLYMLGAMGESELNSFFLLTVGIILAFSPVISMEYQSGAWEIICATPAGKKTVTCKKIAVCAGMTAVFSFFPFACRWICVAKAFPLRGLLFPAQSIPFLQDFPVSGPIFSILFIKAFLQVLTGLIIGLIVFGLSAWCKNHIQTIIVSLLILVLPLALSALGFDFAQYFSLYPLYSYVL